MIKLTETKLYIERFLLLFLIRCFRLKQMFNGKEIGNSARAQGIVREKLFDRNS